MSRILFSGILFFFVHLLTAKIQAAEQVHSPSGWAAISGLFIKMEIKMRIFECKNTYSEKKKKVMFYSNKTKSSTTHYRKVHFRKMKN